ncbi:DUF2891 domain-containing protein [Mesonia aquimarina]|uniref:DUF2891 domain-containing protein n=1 Tax=Mesonia aquimarina TaxID=1504967 RepID=UPI000EF5D4D4|nr:DUF2891 domain-containing protein [Mesonia aquimarina]
MRKIVVALSIISLFSCKNKDADLEKNNPQKVEEDTSLVEEVSNKIKNVDPVILTKEQADKLAELPLACINNQYPYKLGQTLTSEADLKTPKELHPAFYGCFDWHSSVHGHWSLVSLLKQFPNLNKAEAIKKALKESLSPENIQQEVAYFQQEQNKSFERTYGWAWVLKLAEEIHTWDTPLAKELEKNLQPLTDKIVENYMTFLPKLNYPIRVGEHENTAFGLAFAYDYAQTTANEKFINLIAKRAKDFYLEDDNCPISWEPGGFDFLSPCLEEVAIMQRVLSETTFKIWLKDFMPQLMDKNFDIEVAEVSDREDGKLVHLDGLNYSRAWVFYNLANKYQEDFKHLQFVADKHVAHSFPSLMGDSYEGGHWLGTFAIYSLQQRQN